MCSYIDKNKYIEPGLVTIDICVMFDFAYLFRTILHECGHMRTLKSLQDAFQAWTESGLDRKDAKHYGNVIHPPLLTGHPDQLVLDVLPPPELHLLLGAVNTLFTGKLKGVLNPPVYFL